MLIRAWESLEQAQIRQEDLEIAIGGSTVNPKSSEKKGFKEWVASRSRRLKYIVTTQLGVFCK